jgi:uncharacterized protein (DUF983 family)
MNRNRRTLISMLLGCIRLRCPACGEASIVKHPFRIKDQCSACGVVFNREEGFFVGAILINVATTEAVILAVYLVGLPIMGYGYERVLTLLFIIALVFPVSCYHHSWSIWLTFDHLVESLPKAPKSPPAARFP